MEKRGSTFRIINLDSQADAMWQQVHGWSAARILEWFQLHGDVQKVSHPMDDKLYMFQSNIGIRTGFRLTNDGQLIIIRDHTMYQPGIQ